MKELTPEQQKLADKESKKLEKQAIAKEKQAAKLAGLAEKKGVQCQEGPSREDCIEAPRPNQELAWVLG